MLYNYRCRECGRINFGILRVVLRNKLKAFVKSMRRCEKCKKLRRERLKGELFDAITYGIPLDRLREMCVAEREQRCVVLPCKVGTRVWAIGQNCDLCRDMYAEEPCLFGSCEYKEVFESVFGYGMIDNFGKTVFLTREEAEAALRKEQSDETHN